MNNKDQSQNGAVDNGIFTATSKTTETNENETKSESVSSVKRYVPPHLRSKITTYAKENIGCNLERIGLRGGERGLTPESGDKEPSKNLSDQQNGDSTEKEAVYELKPRDIHLEKEWFPENERDDNNWQHNYPLPTHTIQVFGDDVPAPIQSLADIDLGPVIMNNIALSQYEITSTQKYALPLILSGHDVMVHRPLGMAIIHAYLFAIIAKLTRVNPSPSISTNKVTPQCVILTPTRELALQIFPEARKFAYRSHLKTCMVLGGVSVFEQIKELKRGCDILVATPGRLVDMVDRGVISLANVKFLCLEEVDRMLDMGFEPQLRRIVEEHDMPGVGVRQTLLFSATFPKEVQRLAQELMYDYVLLSVNRVDNEYHNGSNMCTQTICFVNDEDKHNAIIDALDAWDGLALVYVSKKVRAEELNTYLQSIGLPSTCIHGDRTQQEREEALMQFRQGIKTILVATDVFAIGLETPPAAYVINYDMPSDIDSYLHRIRRVYGTASKRFALSFFSEENKSMAKDLVELLEQSDQEVPDWLREYAAENHRDTNGGHGVNVHSGRGGRGRGGSRGFGARARGRGYAENRFEPYGRGQSNTNNHHNGSENEYSSSASNTNGNNDGGSHSSNGGSNTNWW